MKVTGLDHRVLTVRSVEDTVRFYREVLGMERVAFGPGRVALRFGEQNINLHQAGREFEPKAGQPVPGSADLCVLIQTDPRPNRAPPWPTCAPAGCGSWTGRWRGPGPDPLVLFPRPGRQSDRGGAL